jgi:hypothetical protein
MTILSMSASRRRRYLVAMVLAVVAPPGAAANETKLTCDPDTMNCSPIVACIETTGEMFRGSSFGTDLGPLRVDTDEGVTCTGTWRRAIGGIGLAEFSCSDGRYGTSVYTWFEPETGTAVGQGTFADGTTIKFWAGNNLDGYFANVDPSEVQKMACPPDDMLLS